MVDLWKRSESSRQVEDGFCAVKSKRKKKNKMWGTGPGYLYGNGRNEPRLTGNEDILTLYTWTQLIRKYAIVVPVSRPQTHLTKRKGRIEWILNRARLSRSPPIVCRF